MSKKPPAVAMKMFADGSPQKVSAPVRIAQKRAEMYDVYTTRSPRVLIFTYITAAADHPHSNDQQAACRAEATRLGFDVAAYLSVSADPALEAAGLRSLLQCVKDFEVDVVLVHSDDGTFWPTGDKRHVLESLGKLGCHLVFVLDRRGFTPPAETTDIGALS